jgi:hypothetical protein
MGSDECLEWFRSFVAGSQWRFAKTYVESYPHEYTLQRWRDADDFSNAIDCIERWGVVEPFLKSQRKYFYVDERKYWHMGNPASPNPDEHPGLINRTWIDVAGYREDARSFGYDEQSLERLVVRWRALLDRARR